MKKDGGRPGIQYAMIRSIILFVLIPLFAMLAILANMLARSTRSSIEESYSMMFGQLYTAVDNLVMQENYYCSSFITYAENQKLITDYYNAKTPYQRNLAESQIMKALQNMQALNTTSMRGEMILMMRDGRVISSSRALTPAFSMDSLSWLPDVKASVRNVWDQDMLRLFEESQEDYLVFGRAIRYYQTIEAYAFVRIRYDAIRDLLDEKQNQNGIILMLDETGRCVSKLPDTITQITLNDLFAQVKPYRLSGQSKPLYHGPYMLLSARLAADRTTLMYIGQEGRIMANARSILRMTALIMISVCILLVFTVWLIAKHITSPLRRLAGQIRSIEQSDMPLEAASENDYSETHELEEGIISAHKRIGLLIEEVRAHATEEENAKFEALKAQINPHFLFNTLNAIQWKASINGDAEVSDALSKLGVLLSEMYKNNDQLETIGNTMRTLEAYVTIMEIRYSNQIHFFMTIPEEMKNCMIPRFCLQPLVENAFIHGLNHTEQGIIVLRGEFEGVQEDIVLTLIDNGSGVKGKTPELDSAQKDKHRGSTGIGLPNVHKRIRSLFGEPYGLSIDTSVDTGFKILMRIPKRLDVDAQE